ncbi:hypothetical protein IVA82_22785 [Bradyrhizobium sp. 142]|nr:hypothetical protein [Bradyrhizobium sp. 142]
MAASSATASTDCRRRRQALKDKAHPIGYFHIGIAELQTTEGKLDLDRQEICDDTGRGRD